jgi:signal peptidase I
MKNILSFLWEIVKIIVVSLLIVIPIRYFLFQPFIVRGASMEPNFHNGDYLIIDEISYRFRPPQRGETIVFKFPQDPSQRYIKRIIGLPGETVEIRNGKIIISKGEGVQSLDESSYLPSSIQTLGDLTANLKDNEYFVLGDNRPFSSDSRKWGDVPEKFIIGRVLIRAWPFASLAEITVPQY